MYLASVRLIGMRLGGLQTLQFGFLGRFPILHRNMGKFTDEDGGAVPANRIIDLPPAAPSGARNSERKQLPQPATGYGITLTLY